MLGKSVGHYQLAAELGTGGMGLVYRAHDRKLGREVALKFLAPDLSLDRKAVERFEREARAAAAINHPNICTIYEVGEQEGRPFIAMELLEGETLRDRIGNQPLQMDSMLDWAIQITEGLEAAHQLGILHRDIKPGNLFITNRGLAKILDFGLAKQSPLTRPLAPGPQTSITTIELLTDPRMAAGTPQYMSPEQARGEELDVRTDLFSLGAVLYEMATGKRPFQAGTSAAILGAILYEHPESPVALNPDLPDELVRIIHKALEKDRDLRYQHAADIRADLKRLRRDASTDRVPTTLRSRSSLQSMSVERPMLRRNLPSKVVLAGTLLGVLVVAFGVYFAVVRRGDDSAFQMMTIERLTNVGEVQKAAISPDGRYLAYAAGVKGKPGLWVRQIPTQSDLQIQPAAAGAYIGLTFSPDGNYIYFVRDRDDGQAPQLFQIPAIGGESRLIARDVNSPISFSPDGRRFAFLRETASKGQILLTASVDGGAELALARRTEADQFALGLAWSPDGSRIAASAYSAGKCFVMVVPATGGHFTQVGLEGWQFIRKLAWVADGSSVILTATPTRNTPEQIWQLFYPSGRARRITNDLNNYVDLSLTSDSRTAIAVQAETRSNLWTVPDAKGAFASQLTFSAGTQDGVYGLASAADGRLVYASMTGASRELWMTVAGARPRQITTDADIGFFSTPSVCPDGRTTVYGSGPLGNANIWRVDSEGGRPRSLTAGGTHGGPSCSADGKWIYFNTLGKDYYSLWRAPFAGGAAEQLTRYSSTFPLVSPDGKWVAYRLEEPNRIGFGVIPAGGGEPVKTFNASISGPGGTTVLRWSPSGDAVDYVVAQNGVSNIWRQPLSGNAPHAVTDFTSGLLFNFVWLPNGSDLVVARGSTTSDVVRIRRFEGRR